MASFVENEIDTVSRDLRYLISFGKVSQQQTITDIAEKTLELLKEQQETIETQAKIIEVKQNQVTELVMNQQRIVRCKDCRISKMEKVFKNVPSSKEQVRWCELIQRYVDDDWYCADGELKE